MNQERRFDDLARTLANGQLSRGQILKLAGGALLGSVLGGFGLTVDIVDAEAKKKRRGKKKKRGKKKGRGSNTPPAVDSSDLPSAESIALARSLLAAGATDVPLSPAGYFSYHRALNGTFVTSEEVREGNVPVLTWNHTITESTGQEDADRDGFVESRTKILRGQSDNEQRVEITDYSPTTRAIIGRQTYTRTGPDTIHALWERDDGSGNLVTESEFDTTLTLTFEDLGEASQQALESAADICPPGLGQEIAVRLNEVVAQGFRCMRDKGRSDIGFKILNYAVGRGFNIMCGDPQIILPGKIIAQIGIWSSWATQKGVDKDSVIDITVNQSLWIPLTIEKQKNIVWHELLHLHFGAHNGELRNDPRITEIDQSYACASLCFTFNPDQVTKCSCARCLETHMCDSRCQDAKFVGCEGNMGSGYDVRPPAGVTCSPPPPPPPPCPQGQSRSSSDDVCTPPPPPPPMCKPAGSVCRSEEECCSGSHCTEGHCCDKKLGGERCTTNEECCTPICCGTGSTFFCCAEGNTTCHVSANGHFGCF